MGKINKEWHQQNKMPAKATFEQRVSWHRDHLAHCACRTDLPADVEKAFNAEKNQQ